eukprot:TRINITY_DN30732_c0_g1_i1.p1 TRINITY_DN30732_c0_g1~~TRINITY_DN30732_c0_g1_i1.p1  ORF type:complete len:500 (+),score=80.49 TRINITY_DN30732_c0_g1_i1:104-1603(+)
MGCSAAKDDVEGKPSVQNNSGAWPDVETLSLRQLRRCVGCKVERAEERAISLKQLKGVANSISYYCARKLWKAAGGEKLTFDKVDVYELVEQLVRPATKYRKCSYVELVAAGTQKPSWFASVYWGTLVNEIVRCLDQHCKDRCLESGGRDLYWLHVSAEKFWTRAENEFEGVSTFPHQSILSMAKGTVVVVDKAAQIFNRVWCLSEMLASVQRCDLQRERPFLFDVYTCQEGMRRAVGLTTGIAACDTDMSAKLTRERQFPLQLLERAMEVNVQRAQARSEEERRCILNSLLNEYSSFEAQPLERLYAKLNGRISQAFAQLAWSIAFEAHTWSPMKMEVFSKPLRMSGADRVAISLAGSPRPFRNAMLLLARALPTSVRIFELNLDGFDPKQAADSLKWTLECLEYLRHFSLHFSGLNPTRSMSERAGERFCEALANTKLNKALRSLSLYADDSCVGVAAADSLTRRALTLPRCGVTHCCAFFVLSWRAAALLMCFLVG